MLGVEGCLDPPGVGLPPADSETLSRYGPDLAGVSHCVSGLRLT
jgi:hypothetical protein